MIQRGRGEEMRAEELGEVGEETALKRGRGKLDLSRLSGRLLSYEIKGEF